MAGVLSGIGTEPYDFARRHHVQRYHERIDGACDALTQPLDHRLARRDRRLRQVVQAARTRSPWHRDRLPPMRPGQGAEDYLAQVAPMTKADVMAHWNEISTDRSLTLDRARRHLDDVARGGQAYLDGKYHIVETGGTSNANAIVVWDSDGWLEARLAATRGVAWLTRYRGWHAARWAFVMSASPTHISVAQRLTFGTSSSLDVPATTAIPEIVNRLNGFRPDVVLGYPSVLRRLAHEAVDGRLHIRLTAVCVTAEPCSDDERGIIEAAFGAPVLDYYGSTEAGTLAHSFPGIEGLFVSEETVVIEPVDPDGRPVPDGEVSAALLVTNVVNHVLPLIRYVLEDEVAVIGAAPEGPWTARRIAPVSRYGNNSFIYSDTVHVHPRAFFEVLSGIEGLVDFQVRQAPTGADISVFGSVPIDTARIERLVSQMLSRTGLPAAEVVVRQMNEPIRHGAGSKHKRFLPLTAGGCP